MNALQDQGIFSAIAAEIGSSEPQVEAAVGLLDGGASVPFVARYRKEATGGLDDAQLRKLEQRLTYLRDLEKRRGAILEEIGGQGKLTDVLKAKIAAAATKAELEDLYLPYKKKRKTRADTARENGLQPLAEAVMADQSADPRRLAEAYLNEAVADVDAALSGARDILSEQFAENADTSGRLRERLKGEGRLVARATEDKTEGAEKFSDYFNHEEAWKTAPGHRVLAMLRGRDKGHLTLDIVPPEGGEEEYKAAIAAAEGVDLGNAFLADCVRWTWRVKLSTRLKTDLMGEIRERAETEALDIFSKNLRDVLLAAPAGSRTTIGLDPGVRTGVKVAVVDRTGKVVDTATVYPFQPRNDADGAKRVLKALAARHGAELIAIGNGTASRETDRLAADVIAELDGPKPQKIVVSEQGASIYSASELASRELPDLDVSLRGAVSIARRLQDPLAELVKIDPKSIGVGQYQHDVDQVRLAAALDAAVEDAVNAVGVDLNTASPAILARVSGLGASLAEAVVAYRDANGAYRSRRQLMKVPRLGEKAFEQCAGFLRIRDGDEPLDASSVHPEAYDLARRIVKACGRDLRQVMGDPAALKGLRPETFADDRFGLPTVRDILGELEKPGRDPRPEFRMAAFDERVHAITDLKTGMRLEGTVTNVTAFGAFVDIGVHQDGLVHVSQLADRFVKDPSEIVRAGDIVRVTVVSVDVARKRIGLSLKSAPQASQDAAPDKPGRGAPAGKGRKPAPQASKGALGDALSAAMNKKR